MQYTKLGATGLDVSVAGLGCGGNSRIGLGTGLTEAQSVDLVRAALDLGITYFDTAEAYGTEPILGRAIKPSERSRVVIGTKVRMRSEAGPRTAADMVASLDQSLRHLNTDFVDVLMLHGLRPNEVESVRAEVVPVLLKEKQKGKFRHLGASDAAARDPTHTMIERAVADPAFEVVMLAFHLLHQNARTKVFPLTRARGVGTLMMFVVRNIFSKPTVLADTLGKLAAEGRISADVAREGLDFLVHAGGATSLFDAAYRFVRHEHGADVVLFGTGSVAHMQSNVASILAPPLPEADRARLAALFGHLEGIGLDPPIWGRPLSD